LNSSAVKATLEVKRPAITPWFKFAAVANLNAVKIDIRRPM